MIKELENKEHQQENLLRSIINLFVYNNCDYFIYLDVKQNSYTMFSGSRSGTPPSSIGVFGLLNGDCQICQ